MSSYPVANIILIITTIGSTICSIIAAWKANSVDKKASIAAQSSLITATKLDDNTVKLDDIHNITNGKSSRLEMEVEKLTRKCDYLQKLIAQLADGQEAGALERARIALQSKEAYVGMRRAEDILPNAHK